MNAVIIKQSESKCQNIDENFTAAVKKTLPTKSKTNQFVVFRKNKVKTKPKSKTKRSNKQTPMATLEMVLTTKEFQKIQQLPKLPTDKNEKKVLISASDTNVDASPAPAVINLPKPLPKCITVKPVNTWKTHIENLRKTVEEKLKETTENNIKENVLNSMNSRTLSCVTQTTQTAFRGFETCGFVRLSKKDKIFSLTCFNCAAVFELSDWQQYMVHFNNAHKFEGNSQMCNKSIKVSSPSTVNDITTTTIEDTNSTAVFNNKISAPLEDIGYDEDVGTLHIKDFKGSSNRNDFNSLKASILGLENESSTTQNTAVVDFYMSHSTRNLKFLKILHAHPLLWHPRRYGFDIFDKEAEKFLNEFDNTMATADLHSSLINARELHRRFNVLTPAKKTKLEKEPQLQLYVELLNDIATLSKSYAYNCDHCSYYFLDENDLFKHKFKKHKIGDISHICSCGLHFADLKGKEAHEATHNTEPNFTCEHCGLSFFSRKKVNNHIVLNHPDAVPNPQPYQCPKCDEKFAQQYMLKWHILKHDPPRYKCETCGKAYRKAFEYKHHKKAHLNQRDFICEECGKSYIGKGTLRKHLFKVHQAGKHVCMPCKTYFTSNENLHEHMQKFHPDGANLDRKKKQHAAHVKKYQERLKAARPCGPGRKPPDLKCKQCGIEFCRIGELRQHKREFEHYLGDRRYKCPHCESILNSDQTFVMHLRKMHQLPAKYSDMKYFQPYTGNTEENIEVVTEEIDADVEYVDGYEEVNYAVHNLNYADNESDMKCIGTSAVANYEEVQYSITDENEKTEYLQDYQNDLKVVNENE